MRRLRLKVDQIDLKILQLLRQRTRLSGQIGEAKRRHRAVVYVPEREHDLLARVVRLSRGQVPPKAVIAIYREILSSSRAAQGQGAIGVLKAGAETAIAAARWRFGACDQFTPQKDWATLARGLAQRKLAAAVVAERDLAQALAQPAALRQFLNHFTVAGDFPPLGGTAEAARERIFIVIPLGLPAMARIDRVLVLIKCKSTEKAVKSLLHSMAQHLPHFESSAIPVGATRGVSGHFLLSLTLAKAMPTRRVLTGLALSDVESISMLGTYLSSEGYGG